MEGLGAIVRRWEDEIESMVNSNASIRNVVARDVVTSLSSIENSLVQSTLSQVPYELRYYFYLLQKCRLGQTNSVVVFFC